jgi:hypothetical protein
MSNFLRGESAVASPGAHSPAPPSSPPGPFSSGSAGGQRNNTLTVIAGVGVLLLAMGVGVLIGRSSGSSKQPAAAPQVISVASAPTTTGASTTQASETSFTSTWPAGKSGYTVQLQTLPESGTTVSAVESAKSAATGKGAKAVGALKSEEFTSLTTGSYVIYSGVYTKKAEAEKALTGVKKSFPGAKVIKVSNGGGSASTSEPPSTSPGGVGQSENRPAPPSVLKSLKSVKGKSYEEKSKNLPDVVED